MDMDALKGEASDKNTSPERLKELAYTSDEIALLVAANPAAAPEFLEKLALRAITGKNREMQKQLVSNPNTPTRFLIAFSYEFPEEFFNNPAYNVAMFDSVDFNSRWAKKSLLKFAFNPNTPSCFLELAAEVCESNIKFIRGKEYISYIGYEELEKLIELLSAITAHKNMSRRELSQLANFENEIISKIAKLRLSYLRDDKRFWDKLASYKQLALISYIPRKLLYQLLQSPNVPINLLRATCQIVTSAGILNLISNHPKTPKDILEGLAESKFPFVASAAKLHINYAGAMETGWREVAESTIDRTQLPGLGDWEKTIELRLWGIGAINESAFPYLAPKSMDDITKTLLRILCSADTDRAIFEQLKNHPQIADVANEFINYLYEKESGVIDLLPPSLPIENKEILNRILIFHTKQVPNNLDELFIKALKAKWWRQTVLVIGKAPTVYEILTQEMRESLDYGKRIYQLRQDLNRFEWGGYREHATATVILSNIEFYGLILASHPDTPARILAELAKHRCYEVRVLVARHPNINPNSLNILIDDPHPEVSAAALANPKIIDATFKEQLHKLENSDLSPSDLEELADSPYSLLRARVARHPGVNSDRLRKLAHDKLIVRLAVAKNPKTPPDILTKFAEHQETSLVLAVANNTGAPKDLLMRLATQPGYPSGFHFNPLNLAALRSLLIQEPDGALTFLDRCLKYPNQPSFPRFLILMNPEIPASFLTRYYQSPYWPERFAIAQNPRTEAVILRQLAEDPNIIVRGAARDRLGVTAYQD